MSKRVAIVQSYLPHYRHAFFAGLASNAPDLDIEVLHGGPLPGEEPYREPAHFQHRRFENLQLHALGYRLIAQPGILRTLTQQPPDVVVLDGRFGVITNGMLLRRRQRARLPSLYWSTGWDNPMVTGFRHRLKRSMIRRLLRRSSGYIAYGSAARRYLMEHGAPADRVTIAQNTIDVEQIVRSEADWLPGAQRLRTHMGFTDRKIIGYVGGINPLKRLAVLVDAFGMIRKRHPDAALLIVGDGPDLQQIRSNLPAGLAPHVHFAGSIVDGVDSWFAAMDLFVLPGIGGLALNQAMAVGLPVIATIADGTQEDLIEAGRNGFIAAVDDPDALASCMEEILEDASRLRSMGQESRKMILDRASLDGMIASFTAALNQPLG